MEEIRYYLRGMRKEPVITVVTVKCRDDYYRGVSICSQLDMSCKKVGYLKAAKRAAKAVKGQIAPIKRQEALSVFDEVFYSEQAQSFSSSVLENIIKHGKIAALKESDLNEIEKARFARIEEKKCAVQSSACA